ncbi:MAG: F0F1 ATP synthase subunit alpha [bacterium]|nr:F0F1 ATP synthase subunit alpha [bacterium]
MNKQTNLNQDIKNLKELLESRLKQISFSDSQSESIGQIEKVYDGIVWINGLSDALMGEILELPQKTFALVLNLEQDRIGAIIFGRYQHLKEGDIVKKTGNVLSISVGDQILGRVVNSLAQAKDGLPAFEAPKNMSLEKIAPGVVYRKSVTQPLQTGIMAIDAMIPIGRGQRELIIGDRSTGKTSVALSAMINQKNSDVINIYVAIGQKEANVAWVVQTLKEYGVMDKTVIVDASASESSTMQYLAPYAGAAIAEYFMEQGKDVLIIYDDLSKHAVAYRELSLLLKRPSGREAYPGDVFYLHSRLLERACRLDEKYGGGSITALPIIETQEGDVSAYIPTNVISITDGQIYLEADLFNAGIRPAINVGISVSRVGGAAQIKAMKQMAGKMRLELAQFRELEAFAQFSSELDEATQKVIDRGKRLTEVLKQHWSQPLDVIDQIVIIWAVTNGVFDDIDIDKIHAASRQWLSWLKTNKKQIFSRLIKDQKLTEETLQKLEKIKQEFKLILS